MYGTLVLGVGDGKVPSTVPAFQHKNWMNGVEYWRKSAFEIWVFRKKGSDSRTFNL